MGALLTGVFAQKALNGVADGAAVRQSRRSSAIQATAVLAAIVYSGVVSFVLLKLIALVMPLRAEAPTRMPGLDVTQHGEEAYVQSSGSSAILHRSSAADADGVPAMVQSASVAH